MSNAGRGGDAESNEMRSNARFPAPADLENLLDGRPVQSSLLSDVLGAARGAAVSAELTGLNAACAAFSNAYSSTIPEPQRSVSTMKSLANKMLAAKAVAIGGIAIAATAGGVALAATGGGLPFTQDHPSHASANSVRASDTDSTTNDTESSDSSSASSSSAASSSASESDSATATPSKSHPAGVPNPSLVGLCHSWLARPHLHGNADTNPAFTVLVTAAGGTGQVNAYCTTLLHPSASSSSPAPSTSSSVTAEPTHGRPTDAPSHPTGKPSIVPPSHPAGH